MIYNTDFYIDTKIVDNKKILLVSGSNSKYYNLLLNMIQSLKDMKPFPSYDIACFDLGLEENQKEKLENDDIIVKKPKDFHNVLPLNKKTPATLASVGKITLPEQFPNYDLYMWIDADIWFQTPIAIQLPIIMASKGKMVVVPEFDRSNIKIKDQKKGFSGFSRGLLRFFGLETRPFDRYRQLRAKQAFKKAVNAEATQYYHLNGGVFSISSEAPHWKEWFELYKKALKNGPLIQGIAQSCISYLWLENKLSFLPLPPTFNWVCHLSKPIWDKEKEIFVTPLEPHEIIHTIHLTTDEFKNSSEFNYQKRRIENE